jgi:DNA-binding transcriptional ArsR family regulator
VATGPASTPDAPDEDHLSEVFAALADPTRRAILSRLATGEATVNELAEPFDISFQGVSKHLKVLERAGLVTRSRQAQYRPVRLEPAGFDPATAWLAEHRAMRLAQLDRLEQTVRTLRGATRTTAPAPPDPAPPTLPPRRSPR